MLSSSEVLRECSPPEDVTDLPDAVPQLGTGLPHVSRLPANTRVAARSQHNYKYVLFNELRLSPHTAPAFGALNTAGFSTGGVARITSECSACSGAEGQEELSPQVTYRADSEFTANFVIFKLRMILALLALIRGEAGGSECTVPYTKCEPF